MATLVSGKLGVNMGNTGGYVDYTVTDAGKVTLSFEDGVAGNGSSVSWSGSGSITGIMMEYDGTEYPVTYSSSDKTVTIDYKRSVNEITFWGLLNGDIAGQVDADRIPIENDLLADPTCVTVEWEVTNTAPTVALKVPSAIDAGNTITLSWTTADADGDTVYVSSIVRKLKKAGQSTFTSTTISYGTSQTAITDTIPADAEGGSVYYEITVSDDLGAETKKSSSAVTIGAANKAPTVSLSVPSALTAGKTAALTWTTADPDGDTVTTTKLVRYLKKSGESTFTSITLVSSSTSRTSYTDTIPSDAGGGSVYYVVTVSDGKSTASDTSSTYSIAANKVPEISGTDTDLGTCDLTAPTYSYSVTDEDGHEVSVTESLDGTVFNTFTATLGQTNTLTVPALTWLKTLNGSHTIEITATDSEGASVTRTLTLTKNVTSLSFTLETPLEADAQITKAIEKIVAEIPEGATITIEVCNNGYDASPTWEDVTQRVLNGEKFFFDNTTKTAESWGYNVRVNVQRNSATGDCYVVSMGGYFE